MKGFVIFCVCQVLLNQTNAIPITKNWDILGNIYELLNKHDDLEVKLELVPDDEDTIQTTGGYPNPSSTSNSPEQTDLTSVPTTEPNSIPTTTSEIPEPSSKHDLIKIIQKTIEAEFLKVERQLLTIVHKAGVEHDKNLDDELKKIESILVDIKKKVEESGDASTAKNSETTKESTLVSKSLTDSPTEYTSESTTQSQTQ